MADTSGNPTDKDEIIYVKGKQYGSDFAPEEMADSLTSWLLELIGPTGRGVVKRLSGMKEDERWVPMKESAFNQMYGPMIQRFLEENPGKPVMNVFASDRLSELMSGRDPKSQYATGMEDLKTAMDKGLLSIKDVVFNSPEMLKFIADIHKENLKRVEAQAKQQGAQQAKTDSDFPLSSAIRETGVGTGSPVLDELYKKSPAHEAWEKEEMSKGRLY